MWPPNPNPYRNIQSISYSSYTPLILLCPSSIQMLRRHIERKRFEKSQRKSIHDIFRERKENEAEEQRKEAANKAKEMEMKLQQEQVSRLRYMLIIVIIIIIIIIIITIIIIVSFCDVMIY